MFRQTKKIIYLVIVLGLLAAGTASANGLPTWETAFDPGHYMLADPDTGELTYFVHAVEEFKNDLYIVAGSPGWFQAEYKAYAAMMFRSSDGKNWEPVTDLGFGLGSVEDECAPNYYDTAWDMTVFQNKLYVLPFDACYTRPGLILRSSDGVNWEQVAASEEFGQFHKFGVFHGMLYVDLDTFHSDTMTQDAKVLRSPSGDPGTWEEVAVMPDWSPGSFQTFKGALYLPSDGVWVWDEVNGWTQRPDEIWRTFDGVNWEMVSNGFLYPEITTLGGMLDYKGYLYAGVGYYGGTGGQIWRSKDGMKWEPVMTNGFGNAGNEKIDGFGTYLGKLYAYPVNWEGGAIYRSTDGKTWELASEIWTDPLYFTTHHISDQAVFKDEFYVGVLGPQGVLLKMVHPDK